MNIGKLIILSQTKAQKQMLTVHFSPAFYRNRNRAMQLYAKLGAADYIGHHITLL